jgi:Rps23 Pro-64 3,4-dihydroxylase Tpa1-like proline 4-hydroxylase
VDGSDIAVGVDPTARLDGRRALWSLDGKALGALATRRADEYRRAAPFPNIVLDDMFPEPMLDDVVQQFPGSADVGWRRHHDHRQRKLQWADITTMPPSPAAFVAMLQSAPFLRFLEDLTGIPGLIGDPYCFHGGLHAIEPGGYLKIHCDQTVQEQLWLSRRVNVIVYLDRQWDLSWGGNLELWNSGVTTCEVSIVPRFNRMVVFNTDRDSFHGHPDPTVSPAGVSRRSIALYYYTSGENPTTRSDGFRGPRLRPRPGEAIEAPPSNWRARLIDVSPPALTRMARRVMRREISDDAW